MVGRLGADGQTARGIQPFAQGQRKSRTLQT